LTITVAEAEPVAPESSVRERRRVFGTSNWPHSLYGPIVRV
jgi:hypothetical protein